MWAAQPINNARALSVRNQRPAKVAGSPARTPSLAIASGRDGTANSGPSASEAMSSKRLTSGPKADRHRVPSRPRPSAVSASDCQSTPAVPSSSGCTASISARRHLSPNSWSGNVARNGDATPNGCIAEQTSCLSPGTVSSAVLVPPPMSSAASSTVTATPARASVTAAASPFGPEPTTTASSSAVTSPSQCRFGTRGWGRRHPKADG